MGAPRAQRWDVVGGHGHGGIIVRNGPSHGSQKLPGRLATGSVVEQLELEGDRLRFRLVAGEGPAEGWICTRVKGTILAQPAPIADDQEEPLVPAVRESAPLPSASASAAGTTDLRERLPMPVSEASTRKVPQNVQVIGGGLTASLIDTETGDDDFALLPDWLADVVREVGAAGPEEEAYLITNMHLSVQDACRGGIHFYHPPSASYSSSDRDADYVDVGAADRGKPPLQRGEMVHFGRVVIGQRHGEHWLRVGPLYLPTCLRGRPVVKKLLPASSEESEARAETREGSTYCGDACGKSANLDGSCLSSGNSCRTAATARECKEPKESERASGFEPEHPWEAFYSKAHGCVVYYNDLTGEKALSLADIITAKKDNLVGASASGGKGFPVKGVIDENTGWACYFDDEDTARSREDVVLQPCAASGCLYVARHDDFVRSRPQDVGPAASDIVRHIRSGEVVELFEWDAARQWRRCGWRDWGPHGWLRCHHPSTGASCVSAPFYTESDEDNFVLSPLCAAVYEDDVEQLRRFVVESQERGISLDVRDASGRTPLMLATQWGHATCMAVLLRGGASVELTSGFAYLDLDPVSTCGLAPTLALAELLKAYRKWGASNSTGDGNGSSSRAGDGTRFRPLANRVPDTPEMVLDPVLLRAAAQAMQPGSEERHEVERRAAQISKALILKQPPRIPGVEQEEAQDIKRAHHNAAAPGAKLKEEPRTKHTSASSRDTTLGPVVMEVPRGIVGGPGRFANTVTRAERSPSSNTQRTSAEEAIYHDFPTAVRTQEFTRPQSQAMKATALSKKMVDMDADPEVRPAWGEKAARQTQQRAPKAIQVPRMAVRIKIEERKREEAEPHRSHADMQPKRTAYTEETEAAWRTAAGATETAEAAARREQDEQLRQARYREQRTAEVHLMEVDRDLLAERDSPDAKASWTCLECRFDNPASVIKACVFCDSPKHGGYIARMRMAGDKEERGGAG